MIARHLRTLAEWWRNRRARRAEIVTGWRLRAESEAMLDRAHDLRGQADALFRQADAAEKFSAAQFRDTFLGYALHCDAEALLWQAGGHDAAAAECRTAAAEWRAKAALYVGDYEHA